MAVGLRETQEKLLDLLEFFAEVCSKNNITYWVDGGTLLGAVRHKGFIPWDDDVDVCVLESDHAKLIDALRTEVKKTSNYFLYNDHRQARHITEYLGDCTVLKSNLLPIEIDIIRVKALEKGNDQAIQRDKRIIEALKYFLKKKYDKEMLEGHAENDFINQKGFKARKKMFSFFTDDYLPSLPQGTENIVYSYCYNNLYVKKDRRFFEVDEIFPLSTVEFEGRTFPAPANYASYLTILYGENYMQPPPPESQKPSSKKNLKNILPRRLTTSMVYMVYYLKEIKNWITR